MLVDQVLSRTDPDYVVYVPASANGATWDTGNEHFLVFNAPDGNLAAAWTQSTAAGRPDRRIVFSHSDGSHSCGSWSRE